MKKNPSGVAAITLAAMLWPAAADAACSLRSIVGSWQIQVVATEYVHPNRFGPEVWEENSHISCRIELRRARNGRARGTVGECAGWSAYGSLTPPGPERERFLLVPREACSWSMVSEAVQRDPEVLRTGILGTRGGINEVRFTLDGDTLVGTGSYVIGVGDTGDGFGAEWPARRTYDEQSFSVTLFGVRMGD